MTDTDQEPLSSPYASLPDDLPPVQPPSAGFIVQLFIFPAFIVMGVVAIWWMFGIIAVGEQDWHKLVQDLQSQNLQIRDRAMHGLAQVLDQDSRRGRQGQNLRTNREIARGLSDQLVTELKKNSNSREGIAIQVFLTRALGMMDNLDIVAPTLRMALESQRDVEIRKSGIVSLSLIAGRAKERGESLSDPETVESLVQLSVDSLPVLRQSAAFALGLFESSESRHQLEVLLENSDAMTRVNAAIGLARQNSVSGFAVIRESLAESIVENASQNSDAYGEQFLVFKNILKAVVDLAPKFDDAQKRQLVPLIENLSKNHSEIRIRVDATAALNSLKSTM